MQKEYEKIIKSVLNPTKEKFSKVGYVNGFWYACNGFVIVRCGEQPNDLPIFERNESHPNYEAYVRDCNDNEYEILEIPYTVQQLKEWDKNNRKNKIKQPFVLGTKYHTSVSSFWLGINVKFLINAMSTTKSNKLKIPKHGAMMIMEGDNGFTWFIMGVQLKPLKINETMTIIE